MRERFQSKISKEANGCWNWIGGSRGNGYGAFKYNGKVLDSHRVSYLLFKGEIPDKLFVCHTCDNTKCVNPEHLFLGTARDNHQDAVNKGRIVPNKNEQLKKHPSSSAYKNGCRCDGCKEVERLRRRNQRLKT